MLVTFGGEDLRGLTPIAIAAVREVFPEAECAVVVGPAFSENSFLFSGPPLKIYRNLSAEEMRDIMLASDIAVSAGGQTLYELLRTGTATLTVVTAENQIPNVRKLEALGLIFYAGDYTKTDLTQRLKMRLNFLTPFSIRQELSHRGRHSIDGKGVYRIVEVLLVP